MIVYTVFDVVKPLKDRHYAKLGGGVDKGDFYLNQIYIKKLGIKKFESINFFICYDYIKNNSYINLGDGSDIRIVWSYSNASKTHNVSYISFKKFWQLKDQLPKL